MNENRLTTLSFFLENSKDFKALKRFQRKRDKDTNKDPNICHEYKKLEHKRNEYPFLKKKFKKKKALQVVTWDSRE